MKLNEFKKGIARAAELIESGKHGVCSALRVGVSIKECARFNSVFSPTRGVSYTSYSSGYWLGSSATPETTKRRLTFLAAFQEYCIAENIYQGL